MSLKFKYATYLILVLLFLTVASYFTLWLLNNKNYWALAILAISIYLIMYFLGRVMTEIFILLSLFNHLKKSGGSLSAESCMDFVVRALPKKSKTECEEIYGKSMGKMLGAKLITESGDRFVVIDL